MEHVPDPTRTRGYGSGRVNPRVRVYPQSSNANSLPARLKGQICDACKRRSVRRLSVSVRGRVSKTKQDRPIVPLLGSWHRWFSCRTQVFPKTPPFLAPPLASPSLPLGRYYDLKWKYVQLEHQRHAYRSASECSHFHTLQLLTRRSNISTVLAASMWVTLVKTKLLFDQVHRITNIRVVVAVEWHVTGDLMKTTAS